MARKKKEEKAKVVAAAAETVPATTQTFGLQDVPVFLEQVNEKIKEIKQGMPEEQTTKGTNLTGFGKIEQLDTVEQLLKAASMVRGKAKAYQETAEELMPEGMKVPKFTLNGYAADTWLRDIKARIVFVANKEELAKLEQVKKELEANLSAEAKLANSLKKIADLLNDD